MDLWERTYACFQKGQDSKRGLNKTLTKGGRCKEQGPNLGTGKCTRRIPVLQFWVFYETGPVIAHSHQASHFIPASCLCAWRPALPWAKHPSECKWVLSEVQLLVIIGLGIYHTSFFSEYFCSQSPGNGLQDLTGVLIYWKQNNCSKR